MRDEFGNQRGSIAASVPPQPNYSTSTEVPLDAGKVIAIAGGAAGAIAGLWVLLTEREKEPEPKTSMEQARALIQEAAQKAKQDGAGLGAMLAANVESRAADARKQAKKNKKKAAKRGAKLSKKAESDRRETVDRIVGLLNQTRDDVIKSYGPEIASLVQQVRDDAAHRLDDTRKRSEKVSSKAKKDATRAKSDVLTFAETVKARALDTEHQAEDFVGGVVMPKLKDLGQETQSVLETGKERTAELRHRGEEILPEARKRAEELRKLAEKEIVPGAKKRAEELRKKAEKELIPVAKKRAEVLTHTMEDGAKVAKKTLESSSAEAAAKLHTVGGVVEHQAAEATEAVKRGGRETRSLLLWVALAGVLIFTVFLDEDQQKRLKEIAASIFGEARDMYADMKGEDSALSI